MCLVKNHWIPRTSRGTTGGGIKCQQPLEETKKTFTKLNRQEKKEILDAVEKNRLSEYFRYNNVGIVQLSEQLRERREEIDRLQSEINELKEQLESEKRFKTLADKELRKLVAKNTELQKKHDYSILQYDWQIISEELESIINTEKKKIEELRKETSAEKQKFNERIKELESTILKLKQSENNTNDNTNNSRTAGFLYTPHYQKSLDDNNILLNTQLEALEHQLLSYCDELEQLKRDNAYLNSVKINNVALTKGNNHLQQQLTKSQNSIDELSQNKVALSKTVDNYISLCKEQQEKIQSLESRIEIGSQEENIEREELKVLYKKIIANSDRLINFRQSKIETDSIVLREESQQQAKKTDAFDENDNLKLNAANSALRTANDKLMQKNNILEDLLRRDLQLSSDNRGALIAEIDQCIDDSTITVIKEKIASLSKIKKAIDTVTNKLKESSGMYQFFLSDAGRKVTLIENAFKALSIDDMIKLSNNSYSNDIATQQSQEMKVLMDAIQIKRGLFTSKEGPNSFQKFKEKLHKQESQSQSPEPHNVGSTNSNII